MRTITRSATALVDLRKGEIDLHMLFKSEASPDYIRECLRRAGFHRHAGHSILPVTITCEVPEDE